MAKRRKLNVAVLMGGPSAEHEVSLQTGKMVIAGLREVGYRAIPVMITREGEWIFSKTKRFTLGRALDRLRADKIDVAFIAMHGPFGEDGTIQGLLDYAGIPYTGSGVLASALAMDKVRSYEWFAFHGLRVPKHVVVRQETWDSSTRLGASKRQEKAMRRITRFIGFPCVVKPSNLGSSVGISIVRRKKDLAKAIGVAWREKSQAVLVDEYIKGVEVTCGVLDDGEGTEPLALPLTEIIPVKREFFDYHAKYTRGGSQEITPARISQKLTREVQRIAIKAHTILGCSGMSRADFIIEGPGTRKQELGTKKLKPETENQKPNIYVLEINTIPGMTGTSLLPQAAAAAGIPFPKLLDRIIRAALSK